MNNRLFKKTEGKRVAENFVSLFILNFVNYGFPLILIPYLTRVLGVEKYGLYAFAFASINYFTMLVKYGFEFSATKQIANIRDDLDYLSKVFNSVLTVSVILILIASFLLYILILLVPIFSSEQKLIFFGVGIYIGQGLTPIWFFQGIEKMKFITVINFIVRLVATILIFIFVKDSMDYDLAILFQSFGFIIGAVFSLFIAFYSYKIKFILPTRREIYFQFKTGWHLFLSTIGTNFYRETNTIILGFVTNYTVVGYYAAAEKIIKAVQSLVAPIVHVLYPFFGRKLNSDESFSETWNAYVKIGKYFGVLLLLVTTIVFLFGGFGIELYLGKSFIPIIVDIRIMSPIIIFGGLNYYFGVVGLVNIGKERLFTRSVWVAGISSILICYVLAFKYSHYGASIALLCAELILFLQIMIYFLNSKALPIRKLNKPIDTD